MTGPASPPAPPRVISASAGTGKTHRLTEEVLRVVTAAGPARRPVDSVVAVTYTRKAHGELESRIRRALVEAGAFADAHRLRDSLVGTVHSVCLRLLEEFALEAGAPPTVSILPGEALAWIRPMLEEALPADLRERIDALAYRLQIEWNNVDRRSSWVLPVTEIMSLSRLNRIPSGRLQDMAKRSIRGLLALFTEPLEDGPALEAAFAADLEEAIRALSALEPTEATQKAIHRLDQIRLELVERPGSLVWSEWVSAGAVTPARAGQDAVQPLRAYATRVLGHPRLRAEVEELIESIYLAAELGLRTYQDWKHARRLVDYDDMIDGALRLLESSPEVARELADRVRLLVVDEFQDTTPLQLALFLKLHRLAGESIWVGDAKQCIFEYAGSDPALLDAVTRWTSTAGGTTERLTTNRRSRPELVEACSALFSGAFARFGVPPEDVVVSAARADARERSPLPPFGIWSFGRGTDPGAAIAAGIARLLEAPDRHAVVDRASGALRPLAPGDIGVLVRTNEHARRVVNALQRRGVPAATARDGLLSTPEGTVVDAALRWMLDRRDGVAAAILDALHQFEGAAPDAWLAEQLRRASSSEGPAAGPTGSGGGGWRDRLEPVRSALSSLAPSQVMDRVIGALDLPELCARWPRPEQRGGNLEALRGVGRRFEEWAARQRQPATVAGLVRYLDQLRKRVVFRDGSMASERGSDEQHVPAGPSAVGVSTYHRAKGLEWPVVILGSLDDRPKEPIFNVHPESDRPVFDPEDPLAGRWIRYWPSPFGALASAPLVDRVRQAPEGRRVLRQESHERVRLLYVGFTRARDHLVLAVRHQKKDGPQLQWLEDLRDGDGEDAAGLLGIEPGSTEDLGCVSIRGPDRIASYPALAWHLEADGPTAPAAEAASVQPLWWPRAPAPAAPRHPYLVQPSAAEAGNGADRHRARALEVIRLGAQVDAVYRKGQAWDPVGDAIHRFLAADDPRRPAAERAAMAARLLEGYGAAGLVQAGSLVQEADAFRAFVEGRWPGARWRKEVPVSAEVRGEGRRIHGTIDLLLETAAGLVVIDHKAFPAESESAWRLRARDHAPQLQLYAAALEVAAAGTVAECWLHLPVAGAMVRVRV